mgnify:CR=1 FL=1
MKIAVKIGTNAIFNQEKQIIKEDIIDKIAKDTSLLLQQGNEVIIITSGAVGSGKQFIKGEDGLGLKQAQAAVGQPILMSNYAKHFSKYNLYVSQFLLSTADLDNKLNLANIKDTYKHLVGKSIPIINENDTTATEELSFGDNDALSAQLVISLDFDMLIILTELGALIKDCKPLKESNSFDVKYYDSVKISAKGFGGLKSKLDSVKKVVQSRKQCIIAKAGDNLAEILSGKAIATRFI